MGSLSIAIGVIIFMVGQFYLSRKNGKLAWVLPVLIVLAGIYTYFYGGVWSEDKKSLIQIGTMISTSTLIGIGLDGEKARKKRLKQEKDRLEVQDL